MGDGQSDCTICFELLNEKLTVTPCGHVFHAACLDLWLTKNRIASSCPLCKSVVKEHRPISYEPKQLILNAMETLKRGNNAASKLLRSKMFARIRIQQLKDEIEDASIKKEIIDKDIARWAYEYSCVVCVYL